MPTAFAAKGLYVTGHSYTVVPGIQCTSGQEWPTKLVTKFGMTGPRAGIGISGCRPGLGAATALGKAGISGAWVPGSAGLALIEYSINDYQFGNHATLAQVNNSINAYTAMITALQAGSIDQVTASWSVGDSTATANNWWGSGTVHFTSDVTNPILTVPIDNARCLGGVCWLLVDAESGNTRTMTVKKDGATIATFAKTSQGGTDGVPTKAVIKLTGINTGSSNVFTVEGGVTGAGNVQVEAVIYPAAAPIPVVVIKDPVARNNLEATQASSKPAWDADIETLCATFTNAYAIDLGNGGWWDPDLHLGADRLHPNDAGMAAINNRLSTALKALGY